MFFKRLIRSFISDTNPLLLAYHKLMAIAAAFYYGFPGRKIRVIGVTGTNGKTTVVNMIAKLLTESGKRVGMASTVNFQLGERTWMNATKMSTQSAFFIQKFLRQMVDSGCEYAVLEITSHAIVQSRTWGTDVDIAVLTNVTGDHVEYHGGMEAYVDAKMLLFKNLLDDARKFHTPRVSILNRDDVYFERFDALAAEVKYTYGLKAGDCCVSDIRLCTSGTTFTLHVPGDEIGISLRLPGLPNVYNALAVACVAMVEKIPLRTVQKVLSEIEPVPGRYEVIDCGQPFHVVVDYAHNIDAIRSVVTMYSEISHGQGGRLLTVFGATGGGRDKAKRPVIGGILDQYSDVVILTSDDPYEEDEWGIIRMVAQGIDRREGENFWKIPLRREAIRMGIFLASPADIVLIAGKGAEPVQMIYGQRRDWDDRKVAREVLCELLRG